MRAWRIPRGSLPVGGRTLVMGILNATPDSFSDGGAYAGADAAVARGVAIAKEGADVVDVGGESTRPGAEPVGAATEIRRVVPVIEALAKRVEVPISIDTMKAEVAEAALLAGARIVNDVSGGGDPRMFEVARRHEAGLVLMHMQGDPRTMQRDPRYVDVVDDVSRYLLAQSRAAIRAGVAREAIAIDPGIGFGKGIAHNLALIRAIPELKKLEFPILVGLSRKSFIGTLTADAEGTPAPRDRLEGSLAAAALAVVRGADIVRAHDVRATVRACRVADAIEGRVEVG